MFKKLEAFQIPSSTCAVTDKENKATRIICPSDSIISNIYFASYGNPEGVCGNYTVGSCHASQSMNECLNKAIEISKFLADKVGLTTEDNRRKELENFFKQEFEMRKDPTYRLLLTLNAFQEMEKNPNWVMSKIINTIVEKTDKEVTNQITPDQLDKINNRLNKLDLIRGWLTDKNGKPIIFDKSDETNK